MLNEKQAKQPDFFTNLWCITFLRDEDSYPAKIEWSKLYFGGEILQVPGMQDDK